MLQRAVTSPPKRRAPIAFAITSAAIAALALVRPHDAPPVPIPAPDPIIGVPLTGGSSGGALEAVARSDDGTAIAAWYGSTLEVSWDRGATFTEYPINRSASIGQRITSRRLVWERDGHLAIVEPGALAVHWDDLSPFGLLASDNGISVDTNGDWIAFVWNGYVCFTHDDGKHWLMRKLPVGAPAHPVDGWEIELGPDGTVRATVDVVDGTARVYEASPASAGWLEVPNPLRGWRVP